MCAELKYFYTHSAEVSVQQAIPPGLTFPPLVLACELEAVILVKVSRLESVMWVKCAKFGVRNV